MIPPIPIPTRPEVNLAYNLLLILREENKEDFLECPKRYVDIAVNAVNEITQAVKVDMADFEVTMINLDDEGEEQQDEPTL